MKNITRALALVLCMVLVFSYLPMNALAVSGEPNVFMNVGKTEVNIGDTITVKVSHSEMTVSSFTCTLSFDTTKLECTSIVGPDPEYPSDFYLTKDSGRNPWVNATGMSTVTEANNNGNVGFAVASTADATYIEDIIFTVTFTAKEAGEVVISLREDSSGAGGYKGRVSSKTVVIKGSEPEHTCTAGAVSYVKGENGKHTKIVACADNCGKNFSETEEACSGGTADCENAAVCEFCGNTYGEAKGHGNFRYEHVAGTATHNVVCGDCGKTVEKNVTCTFENGSHVCKFACGNSTSCSDKSGDGDHKCDVCGKDGITECSGGTATCQAKAKCAECGKEYGEKDANNHVGERKTTYTNNGSNHTVTITCQCGGVVSTETAAHDFKNDAHTCVCGKVEEFTLTVSDILAEAGMGKAKTFTVPYGTKILEYIEGKVVTETQTVTSDTHIGTVVFAEWHHFVGYYAERVNADTVMTSDMEIWASVYGYGWQRLNTGVNWGYSDENVHMPTGWYQIDGNWYYFLMDEETGWNYRVQGLARVPYLEGYGPNAEDVAYAQSNANSKYTDAETAVFVFDEETGVFQSSFTGIIGNRYAVNGVIAWHVGMVEIGGEYYYFVGDVNGGGNIAAEGDVYVSRLNGIDGFNAGDVYNFKDGKLSGLSGLVDRFGDGKQYYYENSKLMLGNGLTKFGEELIYVRSNGQIATGKYWVATTNGICNPGLYNFGDNGFMQTAKDPNVNGLVDGVYYKDGMPCYMGLIEIDGDTYYINSAGEAVTGTYYVTKLDNYTGSLNVKRGDKLTFGADGKLVTE